MAKTSELNKITSIIDIKKVKKEITEVSKMLDKLVKKYDLLIKKHDNYVSRATRISNTKQKNG